MDVDGKPRPNIFGTGDTCDMKQSVSLHEALMIGVGDSLLHPGPGLLGVCKGLCSCDISQEGSLDLGQGQGHDPPGLCDKGRGGWDSRRTIELILQSDG